MPRYVLTKEEVEVSDAFIEKFAKRYIQQRSECQSNLNSIPINSLIDGLPFSTDFIQKVIEKNTVFVDIAREAGGVPPALQDIYRSDLGEMLLTYYFEEKIAAPERFHIPLKNITFRELAGLPGRGLDAIGYRIINDKVELLIGEAKVSTQKKNPPAVVHDADDSIWQTQVKFKNDRSLLVQRLSDYAKRLSAEHVAPIMAAIVSMEYSLDDTFDIVFGCALIRDHDCMKVNEDFGVFYTRQTDFDPYQLSFCILNFDKNIGDTVDLFYKKVRALCK